MGALESSIVTPAAGSSDDVATTRSRRVAVAILFVAWIAFDFPAFAGQVLFPVDIARARPPSPRYQAAPPPDNPLGSDAVDAYFPWRDHLGDRLRDGDLPLWDPHRFAGTPYAANTQMAVWYPPSWLFAAGHPLAIMTALALASRLGALLLWYWFFRVLRLHPLAAAAGAVIAVFCGFQIAWGVHPTFLGSSMWLPLALGGVETAIRGHPTRGMALAGLGLALSVLGGHAQVALYVWLAVALWAAVAVAGRAVAGRAGTRARAAGRASALVAGCFALGIGLSSLQLLSTAELSSHIVRAGEDYDALVAQALPAENLATLWLPDRFGDPTDGSYVGELNYTETALYVGVSAIPLALLGLLRRSRATIAFASIGLVAFLASLGTPLYRLLYAMPGFSQTRAIGRMVFLVDVALAGLAAVGLDAALRGRVRVPVLAAAVGVTGLGVAVAAVAITAPLPEGALGPQVGLAVTAVGAMTVSLGFLVRGRLGTVAAGAAAMVLIADLWAFGFGYFRFQEPAAIYPPAPEIQAVRASAQPRPRTVRVPGPQMPPNTALAYGLYDIHGADVFILTRTVELLSLAQDQVTPARLRNVIEAWTPDALRSPVLDLLGASHVFAPDGAAGELGPPLAVGALAAYRRPGALPPAFLAPCWELRARAEALERLSAMTSAELGSVAIVEDGPEARNALGTGASGPCEPGGIVDVDRYEADRVVLRAETGRRSVLVLTDAWYPGWEATVDGEPAAVLAVDHAVRGVIVDEGAHVIELQFRPGWLLPGTLVTVVSLGITVFLLSGRIRRRLSPS